MLETFSLLSSHRFSGTPIPSSAICCCGCKLELIASGLSDYGIVQDIIVGYELRNTVRLYRFTGATNM